MSAVVRDRCRDNKAIAERQNKYDEATRERLHRRGGMATTPTCATPNVPMARDIAVGQSHSVPPWLKRGFSLGLLWSNQLQCRLQQHAHAQLHRQLDLHRRLSRHPRQQLHIHVFLVCICIRISTSMSVWNLMCTFPTQVDETDNGCRCRPKRGKPPAAPAHLLDKFPNATS